MEKTYITLISHAVPYQNRLHNILIAKHIFIIIIKVPYTLANRHEITVLKSTKYYVKKIFRSIV